MLSFRIWLEGLEDYSPYRNKINQLASGRSFAFDKWFPSDRVYLPLVDSNTKSVEEIQVEKTISDILQRNGYELVDLKNGYAKKQDKPNLFKIGKLLENFHKKSIAQIEQNFKSGLISKLNYNSEIVDTNHYFNNMKTDYQNLPSRTKGDFLVVISKDPHDLAAMSTGRGWTSCMELGKGENHHCVYKEVKHGGFIAYLIRSDDKKIENPIGRIHIRKFTNNKGDSVAIPEETVYGQDIPAFMETVKQWLKSKQIDMRPGRYGRQGGRYSDSLGEKTLIPPDPSDSRRIMSWISKWMNLPNIYSKQKSSDFFAKALQSFFDSTVPFPEKFVQKLKNFLFDEKSIFYTPTWNTSTGQFMAPFAIKYPELISKEDFIKAVKHTQTHNQEFARAMLTKLVKAFPQYADKDLILNIKSNEMQDEVIKIHSHLGGHQKEQVFDDILNNFNVENPSFTVSDADSMYKVFGNISDQLNKLIKYDHLPESIIRKLVDFSRNLDKLDLMGSKKLLKNSEIKDAFEADSISLKVQIIEQILYTLSSTKSDTPTVQRFYHSLLPKWGEIGGVAKLGWAISKLGENGYQFLSFLEDRKANIEDLAKSQPERHKKEDYDKCIENYNYVIDAIKNRTGKSTKYVFNGFGKNIETQDFRDLLAEKRKKRRDLIIKRGAYRGIEEK